MPRASQAVWELQNIAFQITRRRMKHLRITVHPPDGEVKVSVPYFVSNAEVQEFIYERMQWVKDQQAWFKNQERQPQLRLLQGEPVYLWGKVYTLRFASEKRVKARVWLHGEDLVICAKENADFQSKMKLLTSFYRSQLGEKVPYWLAHWEPRLGVKANEWGIKKMRTRWGSCNITDARVWVNLDLARYPELCLQYVVLHELAHLLESNHSARFWAIVENYMPEWQEAARLLKAKQLDLAS